MTCLATRAGMLRLNARRCIGGQFCRATRLSAIVAPMKRVIGPHRVSAHLSARVSRIVNHDIVLSGLRLRLQRTAYRENRTPRATHDLLGR